MDQQSGILELFRNNRNFTRLYLARVVSMFGDWFNFLALIALLRELGQQDALSVGLMLIFKTLPTFFMTPLAGVIADRYSRRSIMIVTDILRFLAVAAIFLVIWFPSPSLLYTFIILQSAISSFFDPARQAILPDIVSERELTTANAVGAATWSTILAIGSALGGLVTAYLGWRTALAIDALSYLVSAAILLQLYEPPWQRPPKPSLENAWGARLRRQLGLTDMVDGFHYVRHRPRVFTLMLVKSGWCLAGSLTLILTLLGEQRYPIFGEPMLGLALLYIARGLGTGIGPFLARRWASSRAADMERSIIFGFLCGGSFYLLLPFAPNPPVAALTVALAHLGGATVWVMSTVRLQQIVPSVVRGRVFAVEQGLFTTITALSTWCYGALIDSKWLGLSNVVRLVGLSLLLPALAWFLRGLWLGWAKAEVDADIKQPDKDLQVPSEA